MSAKCDIILGSRGSDLALAQARLVEQTLGAARPGLSVETRIIRTSGDEGNAAKLASNIDPRGGRKGLFTMEIERRLLDRFVDVAVHSAKDLPSEMAPNLEVCAVLARAPLEDVLITKETGGLSQLVHGARVGTSSVRRQHQLRQHRPDLCVIDLRGNVPTRLRKLNENADCDAIVLACAGLTRLGFEIANGSFEFCGSQLHVEILSREMFLPAGGQGVIALQIRADDGHARSLVESVNHRETFLCLRAEREFLRLLQGDCDSPVGVLAQIVGDGLEVRAEVFEQEATRPKTGRVTGAVDQPEALAHNLMKQIYGG